MKVGLFGWFNKNMNGRKGQQGFTLIELLVVVTILGVLAAIVTLSLVGLTTNASVQSCKTEFQTVQAALDAAIVSNNLPTVPAQAPPTNSMLVSLGTSAAWVTLANPAGNITLFNPNPSSTTPSYTRNNQTHFFYEWDASGKITLITKSPSDTDLLPGCAKLAKCQGEA